MTTCDYCGHSVHPPDESGHDVHVQCMIQALADDPGIICEVGWDDLHDGPDDHFLADPAGGGQWVKAGE